MHIGYTAEQERLRDELREYFAGLMTPEVKDQLPPGGNVGEYGDGPAYRDLVRQMGKDGWLGIGWPTEYGGQGRSMLEQQIFYDEAHLAGAPLPVLTINSVGPMIMEHGTEEQKAFYLPKIVGGEIHFAIGYSEADAGTDLASLKTTAVRDGDEYVINGAKMWTSVIQHSDYVWLACRTDPDAPPHRGLSIIVVPTDVPGFSWSPVPTMCDAFTSETRYDDVRVPADNLIGGENNGWRLITGQLNRERVAIVPAAILRELLDETVAWARSTTLPDGRRVIDQEWIQLNLARVHAKLEFLQLFNWKLAWAFDHGGLKPADASANKVFGSEFYTEAYRLLMECFGEEAYIRAGSPGAQLQGRLEAIHRSTLILTFGGGTNEVQRDIVSMTGLGMPRDRA